MARIAAIIADMFEDVEYTRPAEAFAKAGHEVVTVGLEAGSVVTGKKEQTKVTVEESVDDVSVDDFDALLIPGGYSPDKLRVSQSAIDFAADFVRSGKPVFAICHAGELLAASDVLRGRRMTGYKSIVSELKNAGANYEDAEVVVDGNLVSSRQPADLPAFIRESLALLKGAAAAEG
jgi:protease I